LQIIRSRIFKSQLFDATNRRLGGLRVMSSSWRRIGRDTSCLVEVGDSLDEPAEKEEISAGYVIFIGSKT
jgi:hypothetical protein